MFHVLECNSSAKKKKKVLGRHVDETQKIMKYYLLLENI